jgi:predicted MPP superfamily phosphohydrolase
MHITLKIASVFGLLIHACYTMLAQGQFIPEIHLNSHLPGATYKFSFAHITDTHIGEGLGDYGTAGFFNDEPPAVDSSKPARRLQTAVDWINANRLDKNIQFAIVSGDLTDSGEKSEFLKFKAIMDNLDVPYVPGIGNHDVWPYVRYQQEAVTACGDSVMNEVFEDVFDRAKVFFTNWDDGTRSLRTFNPETSGEHYFHNFSFEYDGTVFYMMDFNPRYHVSKPEPGIGPEPQLMDWEGGSFRWWKNSLAQNPTKRNKNIFITSHHPPTKEFLIMLAGFTFDINEYDKLTKMLEPYRQHLALWMGGHIHRDLDYIISTLSGNNIVRVREMAANKEFESAHFQVVHVYEIPNATAIQTGSNQQSLALMPNPNNGVFNVAAELFHPDSKLRLYDVLGNQIFEKSMLALIKGNERYEFDFSFLPKGSYYLEISDNKSNYSQRFVIQ